MSAQRPTPKQIEELLLGGELRYTRVDIERITGLPREFTSRLWRAFGYPHTPDDAVAFTDEDLTAIHRIQRLMRNDALDDKDMIRMVRAVGQTMAKLAEWQVDLLTSKVATAPSRRPGVEFTQLVIELAEKHIANFEPLIAHAWRRQLAASGTRAVAAIEAEVIPTRAQAAVGFADMVSFTQLSRDLDETELARLVERFEETAADVVAANHGRLVKTIGDEVLFSAGSPRLGAEIGLAIAETIREEIEVPDVRVGVAYGPVLPLMGDVFGTTVNLAARLTSIARPGTVVIDAVLAAALESTDAYEITRIVRRPARGLGIIQPYVLRRRIEN